MDPIQLRLYVHGSRAQRDAAVAAVERLVEMLDDEVDVEIIDVLEHPELADAERVLATPTLDRIHPFNPRRTVGDLGDLTVVARHLGLTLRAPAQEAPAG